MLMSVKAPWPPFPFFPYSDLLKIRALQCRQHKHSSWKYSENPGFMQEVWVKYQLQGLKQWCTKELLSFALCKAPKPTVRRKRFLFSFLSKCLFFRKVWKIQDSSHLKGDLRAADVAQLIEFAQHARCLGFDLQDHIVQEKGYRLLIPEFWRQKQEYQRFKTILGYLMSLMQAWAT